jgi:hypothetical protein
VNTGNEFAIGGYAAGSNGIDAIIIGYYKDGNLIYVARTRNDVVPASRRNVFQRLRGLKTDELGAVAGRDAYSDVLQKLHNATREIAEAREQALRRNRLKDTCLRESYSDGKLSLFLHLEAGVKIEKKLPAYAPHSGTTVQFAVSVSHDDSISGRERVDAQEQYVLIGDVEIVKGPNKRIIRSLVRLDLRHHAFKEAREAGVYLNAMKGTFEVLPCFPNGKLAFVRELVRKTSADRAVPCEV